jgi:hypothetical protein
LRGNYREKLFNLLAGQYPIEVLGQTASTLADIVARHPAEVLSEQFKGNGLRTKSSAISPIANGFMGIASG